MKTPPKSEAYDPRQWNQGNLIANGNFTGVQVGEMPEGWEAVIPNKAVPVRFAKSGTGKGAAALVAAGTGRRECFGYVRHAVKLEGGKTYRLRVRLRYEGMEDLNQHLVHGVFGKNFNDGIFTYRKEGRRVGGEARFRGPKEACDGEVRLYFRYSPRGKVWWQHVSLQECEPIPPRPVKIAVSFGPMNLEKAAKWLDAAGRKKVDVALLTEFFNGKGVKEAEPLSGPTGRLMAEKARRYGMYVCGSFAEKRGDLVFNTAPLYDRRGRLVGSHSKNQLYDPEADEGETPGVGYPVFQTDFGKVGIIICYESWFPEPTRLLAYKGAELILFPNAGYYMDLMPARASDNGVWIAAASGGNPSGIWDTVGAMAGEAAPSPTRYGESSIMYFERDETNQMIVATVDLSRRCSPHNWGGPMRSAPGGRRCRQTLIEPIEEELAREARRWWDC